MSTKSTILTDFPFYVNCAKPLVLNLAASEERLLAAAWIRRLFQDSALTEDDKINHIKLLLFFLQKGKLGSFFVNHPSKYPNVPQLGDKTVPHRRKTPNEADCVSDFSGDLRTYCAYQCIDDFGAHCYYALSPQPITNWLQYDPLLLPVAGKPGTIIGGLSEVKKEAPPTTTVAERQIEQKKTDFMEKLKKVVRNDRRKAEHTMAPLGTKMEEVDEEEKERLPPTWGSNLIQVHDLDGYY